MKLDEMVTKFILVVDLLDEADAVGASSLAENPTFDQFVQNWAQNIMFPGRERLLGATIQVAMYGRSASRFTFDTIIQETRRHIENARKRAPKRVYKWIVK